MSPDDPTTAPDTPRYVVTGGGAPTAEELAAMAVALTPVAVADDGDRSLAPAWVEAALQEGVGRRPFVSADDLASAPPLFT